MAVIENLDVILGARTEKMDAGFNRASVLARNFGTNVSRSAEGLADLEPSLPVIGKISNLFKGLGPSAIAAGMGIGALVGSFMAFHRAVSFVSAALQEQFVEIDALGKAADRIGMASDQLAGIRLAANESTGMSAEQVDMALSKMAIRISEAANGSKEMQAVFSSIGLNAVDLANMRPEQQFMALAEAIGNAGNEADQLRVSGKLFEEEGARLVSALRMGPEEIAKAIKWAKDFGIALNDVQVKGVEAMNGSLNRVSLLMTGFTNTVAAELAPAITVIADDLIGWVEGAKSFSGLVDGLGIQMAALYGSTKDTLNLLLTFSKGMAEGLSLGLIKFEAPDSEFGDGAAKAVQDYLQKVQEARKAADQEESKKASQAALEAEAKAQEEREKRAEALAEQFRAPTEKLTETVAEIQSLQAEGLLGDNAAMLATRDAMRDFESAIASFDPYGDLTGNLSASIDEVRSALSAGLITDQAASKMTEELREQFGEALLDLDATEFATELQEAISAGIISLEARDALTKKFEEQNKDKNAPDKQREPPTFGALQAGSVAAFKAALENEKGGKEQLTELKRQTVLADQANTHLGNVVTALTEIPVAEGV